MARKNLSPGVNAQRLAARVAAAPQDEIKEGVESGSPLGTEAGSRGVEQAEARESIAFSAAELELIQKSCVEYKNSLPCYLRSVQRDLRLLESIIKKCAQGADKKRG